MTFLSRSLILKVLQQIRANNGRINRSAISRGLLKNYPAAVIDKSLQSEMAKLITTEMVRRKGICRPVQDWVLLPEGYKMLGATPPTEPATPVKLPAFPAARQISVGISQTARPISPAPVRKSEPVWTPPPPEPPAFEPQMVPPHVRVGASTCQKSEPVWTPPLNRDDVFECLDGQVLYGDGSKADLTPEQLQAKRRAGRAIRCYPPTSLGMRYDPIAACWRG